MAGRELKSLFKAFQDRDEVGFRRAAQAIIEEEEAKQHLALARDLKRLLSAGGEVSVAETVQLPPPPTDRDGDWSLADVRIPERVLDDLVLSADIVELLRDLSAEVQMWKNLDKRGVPRRRRVLFYGPAGCGKSSGAEAVAAELGLPLLVVRLDAAISSYLGETATNLRRVFDYASTGSWVILFDEFDALGKSRDDASEHGEIKRVVNAFLQMLDAFHGASLVIAATNHEHLLDAALWRRFDEVVHFPRPTVKQIRATLRRRLPRQRRGSGVDLESAASRLIGLPFAAAEKVAWDAQRFALLDGRELVGDNDLQRAVAAAKNRPW